MRLTVCRGPTPTTRTPGMTGTSATCRPGGAGVAARSVAIARDRGDAAWASFSTAHYDPGFNPPSKRYQQHASARSWHRLVAPSCCPSARGRRSGPVPAGQALWMPHVRHVGRPSAQQVRATAMGCGASTGTCAACAAPVCLLGVGLPPHATAKHDSTTAPPRPADASRSAPIAGGKVELELMCAEG